MKQRLFTILALCAALVGLLVLGIQPRNLLAATVLAKVQSPQKPLEEISTYEDSVYGYVVEYPATWEITPTLMDGDMAVLWSPDRLVKLEMGVFEKEKPLDIALVDWVMPQDPGVQILSQEELVINDIPVLKQNLHWSGRISIYYFLRGTQVYFVQVVPGENTPPEVLDIISSFRFTQPYERQHPLADSLYAPLFTSSRQPLAIQEAIPDGFRLPFTGTHTVTQGPECSFSHTGTLKGAIDFSMVEGTKVRATQAGTVTAADFAGGYGNRVIIDHGNGLTSLYAHFRKTNPFAVSVGDSVFKGQLIGYSGSTGVSTGPHLHFEVRRNNSLIYLTEIPGLTWTSWEGKRPCGGTATGPEIETNPPQAEITSPAWNSIYSSPSHFLDGNKIRIYAEAEDVESGIYRVELVGFYAATGDSTPAWHQITNSMLRDLNNPKGYYYDWNVENIPDQYDPHSAGNETIRLEIKVYDNYGNLTQRQLRIGLLRRVGRGTPHQQKYIDAYLRANSFIKPGATIVNRHGHMEPYWWPSSTAAYRIVRQDFQNGSIVHDECGLRVDGNSLFCSNQPAPKAYFVPRKTMYLYEDMVAHPEHYTGIPIGAPLSDAFQAAPSPQGVQGIGMSFGIDIGEWGTGGRYSGKYNPLEAWFGDIYYIDQSDGVPYAVLGGIFRKYHEMGGTASPLGFPTSHQIVATASPQGVTGFVTRFQHGDIYWRSDTDKAFAILNEEDFRNVYESKLGTGGWLGFARSDREKDRIYFDGGCIVLENGVTVAKSGSICYECPVSQNMAAAQGLFAVNAAGDCLEPNNGFAEAIEIQAGLELGASCYIGSVNDVDYYKVYVQAGNTIEARLFNLPANYDLYLYNPSQVLLASSTQAGLTDEALSANTTLSGYYYLKIVGANGVYHTTLPYRLKATLYPTAPRPDLTFANLEPTSSQIQVGQTLQFAFEAKNQGQVWADAHRIAVYEEDQNGLSPQLVMTVTVWPMHPDTSQSFVLHHTFNRIGARRLRLVADSESHISESNESNNTALLNVSVMGVTLNGRVTLQKRGDPGNPRWITPLYRTTGGIQVYQAGTSNLLGTFSATTDPYGRFVLELTGLNPGTYDIQVKGANTLSNKKLNVVLPFGEEIDFGILLVGDSNGNDGINGADVSYMVPSFLKCTADAEFRPYADTNNDGCINGADVSAFVPNFLRQGPIIINGLAQNRNLCEQTQNAGGASLALMPSSRMVQVGEIFTMTVTIDTGGVAIDTVDAYLDFDPRYLEVIDTTGAPATSIEPNPAVFSSTTFNSVDNPGGHINFSASRYDPPYLTGSFTAATIRFRSKLTSAASQITFVQNGARMSNLLYFGESLDPALFDGLVSVSGASIHRLYLPLVRR